MAWDRVLFYDESGHGSSSAIEILTAWGGGADVVKVFPATKLGPAFFKDIKGPLPQVLLSPTGGVDLTNAGEFIKAGACFLGVGTALVDKKLVAEKKWDEFAERARQFLDAVAQARGRGVISVDRLLYKR